MKTYSEELKSSVIAKMLPPHNRSVPDLAKETNIPLNTLYTWRSKHVLGREPITTTAELNSPSSTEKFQAVLATATLSEIEVGEPFDKLRPSTAVATAIFPSKSQLGGGPVKRRIVSLSAGTSGKN